MGPWRRVFAALRLDCSMCDVAFTYTKHAHTKYRNACCFARGSRGASTLFSSSPRCCVCPRDWRHRCAPVCVAGSASCLPAGAPTYGETILRPTRRAAPWRCGMMRARDCWRGPTALSALETGMWGQKNKKRDVRYSARCLDRMAEQRSTIEAKPTTSHHAKGAQNEAVVSSSCVRGCSGIERKRTTAYLFTTPVGTHEIRSAAPDEPLGEQEIQASTLTAFNAALVTGPG